MSSFMYILNYIELHFKIKVKVVSIDGETALTQGTAFTLFRDEKGFIVRISVPRSKQQHSLAERSKGVLTSRGTKLALDSGILRKFWKYIYETAGYLLNRSLNRSLGWKSPLAKLNEHLGLQTIEPSTHYFKPFGCKAYAYIHGRASLDKLSQKANIGYFVGYISTNIWNI